MRSSDFENAGATGRGKVACMRARRSARRRRPRAGYVVGTGTSRHGKLHQQETNTWLGRQLLALVGQHDSSFAAAASRRVGSAAAAAAVAAAVRNGVVRR